MKALIFHPALAPYRVDFFNSLNDYYDAVFYFCLKNVSDQKFDQEVLKANCNFECNYISKGFEFLGRSLRFGVLSVIKKEKPEIIFCAEYGQVTLITLLYCKLIKPSIKIYILSDDSIDNSKSRKGLRALLRSYISKRLDGVIFTSKEVSNWYKHNISNSTKTLDFPVIHSENSLLKIYNESIKFSNKNIDHYNLLGKKCILFVGRLVEVKNLFFLIKCFSNLKDKNCNLIIVGEGPLKSKLISYLKELDVHNDVILVGREEGKQLYSWYLCSQLFVLPSIHEPFGAVVNEALLAGCFVLCSKLAGASSLINEDNGLLFDPFNEIEFTNKLKNEIARISPLKHHVKKLKNNRMPFSFQEKMTNLLNNL
jgi:glycosyltransferase involved in cell wall biosynthesis